MKEKLTIQIGNQCWLKENIDAGIMISGFDQTDNKIKEKRCYDNNPKNCEAYGGLYIWPEAMQYKNGASSTAFTNPPFTGYVQGVCPSGWHIPTKAEFDTLNNKSGLSANALLAIGQMTGNDKFGFSALLAGYKSMYSADSFSKLGSEAYFWTTTEVYINTANHLNITAPYYSFIQTYFKNEGYSVRCLKDTDSSMPIPPAPKLISPIDEAVNFLVPAYFTWSPSSEAESYTIQVAADSLFNNIKFTKKQAGLMNSSCLVTGLSNNTTYYWRVNASNSSGASPFSKYRIFVSYTGEAFSNPCKGTPFVNYGGKVYNTVQIGDQCWMKENLNIGTMIVSKDPLNNGLIEKYCYNNDSANCTKYGGLYNWAEAVQYANGTDVNCYGNPSLPDTVKGICPSGWHIPNSRELSVLGRTTNFFRDELLAVGQLTGNDEYGFSALLCGRNDLGIFKSLGYDASFWSSTESDCCSAYYMYLYADYTNTVFEALSKSKHFSVRCLKN